MKKTVFILIAATLILSACSAKKKEEPKPEVVNNILKIPAVSKPIISIWDNSNSSYQYIYDDFTSETKQNITPVKDFNSNKFFEVDLDLLNAALVKPFASENSKLYAIENTIVVVHYELGAQTTVTKKHVGQENIIEIIIGMETEQQMTTIQQAIGVIGLSSDMVYFITASPIRPTSPTAYTNDYTLTAHGYNIQADQHTVYADTVVTTASQGGWFPTNYVARSLLQFTGNEKLYFKNNTIPDNVSTFNTTSNQFEQDIDFIATKFQRSYLLATADAYYLASKSDNIIAFEKYDLNQQLVGSVTVDASSLTGGIKILEVNQKIVAVYANAEFLEDNRTATNFTLNFITLDFENSSTSIPTTIPSNDGHWLEFTRNS